MTLSYQQVIIPEQNNHEDGNGPVRSPSNVFDLKNEFTKKSRKTKRKKKRKK